MLMIYIALLTMLMYSNVCTTSALGITTNSGNMGTVIIAKHIVVTIVTFTSLSDPMSISKEELPA
jgi:hypothetical protein